jgi:putative restriction endonuclease
MVHAVFVSKPDSPYEDSDDHYQFPKTYLSRVEQTLGDRIVYYGVIADRPGRFYKGVAKVAAIRSDPLKQDHYFADMVENLGFDAPVDYRASGGFESKLIMPDGQVNAGTVRNAVRLISEEEFAKIVEAGLSEEEEWPMRDHIDPQNTAYLRPGMAEDEAIFIHRPIVSQLGDRKFRDRKFRQQVLNAYDRRCAFTGLRLINGGGRPEVEAAHIVPVEMNGSDSPRNGLALSGTAHWMFDRGLLSLTDDFTILRSRHLNYDVDHLLNKGGKAIVPQEPWLQPHPRHLGWHRANRFKQ